MAPNQPRPTKAQRREEARAQAKALREEQLKRERQAKITRRALLAGGVVAVAGIGGAVYISNQDDSSGSGSATGGTLAPLMETTEGFPALIRTDGSISFGKDLLPGGDNGDAVVVDLFFDYTCSHCTEFEELHAEEISTLASSGAVTVVLHSVKILGSDWADVVNNALATVLNNEPEQTLAFHKAAFDVYAEAIAANSADYLTVENLISHAQDAGVSTETTDLFAAAIEANTYSEWTELSTETFSDNGLTGTPAVLINGEEASLSEIASANGITDLLDSKELLSKIAD